MGLFKTEVRIIGEKERNEMKLSMEKLRNKEI
jgi:hypothetical protein